MKKKRVKVNKYKKLWEELKEYCLYCMNYVGYDKQPYYEDVINKMEQRERDVK